MTTDLALQRILEALNASKQHWDDMYRQLVIAREAEHYAEHSHHDAEYDYEHHMESLK
jgi:hypothetical protein